MRLSFVLLVEVVVSDNSTLLIAAVVIELYLVLKLRKQVAKLLHSQVGIWIVVDMSGPELEDQLVVDQWIRVGSGRVLFVAVKSHNFCWIKVLLCQFEVVIDVKRF